MTTEIPGSWGWFSGLAIEGDRAYLAATDGLWAYDLSSLEETRLAEPTVAYGQVSAIAAAQTGNRRLLFTSRQVESTSVLGAYDLSEVQKPKMMGDALILDRAGVSQMAWNDSHLYAISSAIFEDESDVLYVIDYHDNTLALQGSLHLPGRALSLAVDGERAAVAGTAGLSILSVADPESLRLLAQVPLAELGVRVGIQDDRALLVAGGQSGAAQLLVFDIRDPANPRQVEAVDTAFKYSSVAPMPVSDAYVVLGGGLSGVEVLETDN